MSMKSYARVSLEALAPQKENKFGAFAVPLLRQWRDYSDSDYTTSFRKSVAPMLVKLIKDTTGMPVKFRIVQDASDAYTCTIMPGVFTEKHPLLFEVLGNRSHTPAFINLVRKMREDKTNILEGSVDQRTGKVGGVLAEVDHLITIGTSILENDAFTPEWVVGLIGHELGHAHSFLVSLAYRSTTAWAIRTAVEALHGTNSDTKGFVITMDAMADYLNLDAIQRKALAETKAKDEALTLIVLDKAAEAAKSELGTSLADRSGTEFLADQYLVRLGVTRGFAEAYNFVQRQRNPEDYYSTHKFLFVESMKVALAGAGWIAGAALTGSIVAGALPVTLVVSACVSMTADRVIEATHTDPYARLTQMRNDLIQSTKEVDDPVVRQRLLSDIDFVDNLLKDMKPHKSIVQKLAGVFVPNVRTLNKQQQHLTLLESLFNNPLYLRQAQLAQIANQPE